jgi:hypothetical protein
MNYHTFLSFIIVNLHNAWHDLEEFLIFLISIFLILFGINLHIILFIMGCMPMRQA